MDKETLSNYGWIVICVLVLAVMIALAGPFGNFVADAVKSTTQGLFDVNQNALDAAGVPGLTVEDQEFIDTNGGAHAETTIPLKFGQKYNYLFEGQLVSILFSETGGCEMYVDDELFESLPDGAFTYTGDGIYYTDTGELFATFPYKDLSIGIQDAILIDACCIAVQGNPIPIHWGKTYIDEQDGSTCIITGIHIYRVYPSNTFNTNIVFDSYNSFATGAIVDYIWGTISDDGTKITINNEVYILSE